MEKMGNINTEEIEEQEEKWCWFCDGSGEGYAPDSRCSHCRGIGVASSSTESWEPDRYDEE